MTTRRGASPRFGPRRLDGQGSLGHLRWPPHPPETGGSPRTVRCSERSSALRFAGRYGSSDSLGKASPARVVAPARRTGAA